MVRSRPEFNSLIKKILGMAMRPLLSSIIFILLATLGSRFLHATDTASIDDTDVVVDAATNSVKKPADAAKKNEVDTSAISEIAERAETLKKQLVDLNRELYQFEEDLLYPANTQVAVFLSLSANSTFLLDSIELQLDDKLITSYLYKENEILALRRGGIQRLYVGSLSDGKHKLTVLFNGQGSNNRYFRDEKALAFNKEQNAKYLQLVVTENAQTREPFFTVKQW